MRFNTCAMTLLALQLCVGAPAFAATLIDGRSYTLTIDVEGDLPQIVEAGTFSGAPKILLSRQISDYDGYGSLLDLLVAFDVAEGLSNSASLFFSAGENQQTIDKIAPSINFSLSFDSPFRYAVSASQSPFDISILDADGISVDLLPTSLNANTFQQRYVQTNISPVPVPASFSLLTCGILLMGWIGRRRHACRQ